MEADMKRLVLASWYTPNSNGSWGLPLLLEGPPGSGKTEWIDALAQEAGLMNVQMLSPALHGEGAFGVVPMGDTRNGVKVLDYPVPAWAEPFLDTPERDAAPGLVFVDEVKSADRGLQPPLLGLIRERRVGFTQFGKLVRVIGATNKADEAANGNALSAPLANRFGHIAFELSSESWHSWLVSGSGTGSNSELIEAVERERVLRDWTTPFATSRGLVSAFLKRRPALEHVQPPTRDPSSGYAWPSRRTWELALRALTSSVVHKLDDSTRDTYCAAFIGDAAWSEFVLWRDKQDIPDPADLLDGKVQWSHDARRLDRTDAVLTACLSLVCPESKDEPLAKLQRRTRTAKLWQLLQPIVEVAADIAADAATQLIKSRLATSADARPVLVSLSPMLQAAGLMPRV